MSTPEQRATFRKYSASVTALEILDELEAAEKRIEELATALMEEHRKRIGGSISHISSKCSICALLDTDAKP